MSSIFSSNNVINLSKAIEERRRMPGEAEKRPVTRIIAVTSGKGGVGKTNVVVNLGMALRKLGKRVLILDADLGLGNLDVLLGLAPKFNLSHVLRGEKSIRDVMIRGPENLMVIPASSGIEEMAQLSAEQRFRMITELDGILDGVDVLLVDTAAGISSNVIYFNLTAQEILVVVTPEPTAITDAYALIKVMSLKYSESRFKLLVNAAASMSEAQDIFRQLNAVAQKFLGISIDYFGCVLFDRTMAQAVRAQTALMDRWPDTRAGRCYSALAKKVACAPPPSHRRSNGSLWNHFCSE